MLTRIKRKPTTTTTHPPPNFFPMSPKLISFERGRKKWKYIVKKIWNLLIKNDKLLPPEKYSHIHSTIPTKKPFISHKTHIPQSPENSLLGRQKRKSRAQKKHKRPKFSEKTHNAQYWSQYPDNFTIRKLIKWSRYEPFILYLFGV